MNIVYTILGFAGSIVLMLWGIHMVQTGIQRASGARLKEVLGSVLNKL